MKSTCWMSVILSAIVVGLFSTPSFAMEGPASSNYSMREFRVTSGDVSLWASSVGESDNVLVLISGGPGASSDYFESMQTLGSKHLRVVRFDMRGTGKSSAPKSDGGYTPELLVQDVESVRRALGATQIHVLGHSYGGLTAMNYAVAYPTQVKALLLYGSSPTTKVVADATEGYELRRRALLATGVIEENPKEGTYEFFRSFWAPLFSDPYFKIPDELLKTTFSDNTGALTLSAFGDYDFKASVSKISAPVLIVAGEADPYELGVGATVRSLRNDLAKSNPEVHLFPDCGHMWQECRKRALKTIGNFLIRH